MKKSILTILAIIICASSGSMRAENIGVPAECEDVMLQAFYWDSYDLSKNTTKYGCTRWLYLVKDSAVLGEYFDLVWLPPCSQSTGGVGYYHVQLSNLTSDWGNRQGLNKLIASLHRRGTKVIGDIVINHRGSVNGWCSFASDNFGTYGSYQLTSKHVCTYDECFTDSRSDWYNKPLSSRGGADTGTNDGGCRDLDHSSEYVQNWAKAYTQWMRNTVQFDGFRYDMTRGYSGEYLKMYNEASNPYFSVSECWAGIDEVVAHLKATNYSTLEFDFPLKENIKTAFVNGSYTKLKKSNTGTLSGRGLNRYAVTFIDNHDMFERPETDACNQEFPSCNANLSDATVKNQILQANAYILMMPGVPCVFWPHWNRYTEEIKELIALRKRAGIHSESVVTEEKANPKTYSGTIQGHKYKVVLRLGRSRSKEVPAGYELALEGGDRGDYTIFIETGTGVENVQRDKVQCTKVLRDGKLYIQVGEKTYDIMGRELTEAR